MGAYRLGWPDLAALIGDPQLGLHLVQRHEVALMHVPVAAPQGFHHLRVARDFHGFDD